MRAFLVGCPRSGTTLLQSMLTAHSTIHSFPETQFFNRMLGRKYERVIRECRGGRGREFMLNLRQNTRIRLGLAPRERTRRHAWEILEALLEDDDRVAIPYASARLAAHVDVYLGVLDALTRRAGKQRWVEKTPTHLHYVGDIDRYVPGAKFIHIIRAGADTVASLYDAGLKYPGEHWRLYRDLDNAVQRWNSSVAESAKYRGRLNHHFVLYRDLIEAPEATLSALCEFLGCAYESSMVSDFGAAARSVVQANEAWKHGNLGGLKSTAGEKFFALFEPRQRDYVLKHLVEADFQ